MLNRPGDQGWVLAFRCFGVFLISCARSSWSRRRERGVAALWQGCLRSRLLRPSYSGPARGPVPIARSELSHYRPHRQIQDGAGSQQLPRSRRRGHGRTTVLALGGARLGALPSPPLVPRTPPDLRLKAGGPRWDRAGASRSPASRAPRRSSSPRCARLPPGRLEWFGPRTGPASEGPRPPFCAAAGGVGWRRCRGVLGAPLPSLAGEWGAGSGGARLPAVLGRVEPHPEVAGSGGPGRRWGRGGLCCPLRGGSLWRPWEFPPCSGTSRCWYLRSSRTGRGVGTVGPEALALMNGAFPCPLLCNKQRDSGLRAKKMKAKSRGIG